MEKEKQNISLSLNLDDYLYEAQNWPGQRDDQFIDLNYVQGVDFSMRCPPWQHEQLSAYGAMGKCGLVVRLLTGKFDYSYPTLRDIAFKDLVCGACDAGSKRNLDLEPLLLIESFRARMVELGYGPMPQHKPVSDNIEKTHNRFGLAQQKRMGWAPGSVKIADKADVLYFVGCRASFIDTEIAAATAKILNAANVPFMVMANEPCCGHYLFTTGQLAKARKIFEDNLKLIRESGAKTVVFGCADCYKTVKVDYPKLLNFPTFNLGFEAKHIAELTDQWIKEGRLKPKNRINMRVTYSDPCNLGRMSEPWVPWEGTRGDFGRLTPPRLVRRGLNGVYGPPRDTLKAIPGIELVEMVRHHENAWCCGNHGGVREAYPDFASWTASERLREAATTGAEAIVSACVGCKEIYASAAKNGMKVFDITELIARAVGK
jgi:Fe-S oxidoreductase